MTYLLAALILLSFPLFVALLKSNRRKRPWAFIAIGALPLMPNLPLTGFLYGWPVWNGTVRGIGVSVAVMLSLALIATRPRMAGRLPFWGLFALYGLALVTSIFAASMWVATVFVWWQFLSILVLFTAVGGEADNPAVRANLLSGFAVGLLYQAAYTIPQKLTGVTQAAGTFGHQNILGLALELAVIPLIAAVLAGDRRKLILAGIAAGLISIAGSGSRATMGIAAVAVVALTLLSVARRPTPRKFGMIVIGAVVLAGVGAMAMSTLNARFQGGGSIVSSDEERAKFEGAAREMAANHALGVGANHYVFVSNRDGYADRAGIPWQMSDRSVPVHNAYLLARAETGWLGEIAFILMILVPMVTALILAFRDTRRPGGEAMLGCAAALMANMAHNGYEFAVHTFAIQALLFINIGMVAAEVRSRRAETKRARPGARRRPAPDSQPAAAPAP